MVEFFIFRHGETDFNKEERIQGQVDKIGFPDIALNNTGLQQAKKLAAFLFDKRLEIIFTSPLLRAKQTAQIVAGDKIEIREHEKLKEMFFGRVEGMLISEFKKEIFEDGSTGKELREKHISPLPEFDDIRHPGGESKREVKERGFQALVEIAEEVGSEKKRIGISTHGAFLRFILSELDLESSKTLIGNCEVLHIKFDTEKKKWNLIERLIP